MSAYLWREKESRKTRYLRKQSEKAQVEPAESQDRTAGLEVSFPVPNDCTGLLIGKKGENLKNISTRLNVTVKLEDDKRAEETRVVIKGRSAADVAKARLELDITKHTIEIPREMVNWVLGKGGRHFKMIRELSGVAVLHCDDGGDGAGRDDGEAAEDCGGVEADEEKALALPPATTSSSGTGVCRIELKGKRTAVADAKLCLDAHLSYYPVFREMEEVERSLDERIAKAQRDLGRRPVPSESFRMSSPERKPPAGGRKGDAPPVAGGGKPATAAATTGGKGGRGRGRGQRPSTAPKS